MVLQPYPAGLSGRMLLSQRCRKDAKSGTEIIHKDKKMIEMMNNSPGITEFSLLADPDLHQGPQHCTQRLCWRSSFLGMLLASLSLSLAEEMSPEEEEDGQEAFQAVMQGQLLSDYGSTLLLPAMGLKALSCRIARKHYLSIEESHLISPRGACAHCLLLGHTAWFKIATALALLRDLTSSVRC